MGKGGATLYGRGMASWPRFRVGTASWTDPTLVASGAFYPPSARSAEERLRFYAQCFDTVEVDSTYYALPSERNAALWVERTPADFVFHFKAFALLTGHGAETARLPRAVKDLLAEEDLAKPRLSSPREEVRDLSFRMFAQALEPLRRAGKLGFFVFQFPPWFAATRRNARYIEQCREHLPEHDLAVEFRHASWLQAGRRQRTFDLLRSLGLAYVIVDEPSVPGAVPAVCEVTAEDAYVRFHGRNAESWSQKGISAAERYEYLYSEAELSEWAGRLRPLRARATHVIFNNCYANFGVMNATTMKQILADR
jgi:uncharacterized protein YecE (DUF72 family)